MSTNLSQLKHIAALGLLASMACTDGPDSTGLIEILPRIPEASSECQPGTVTAQESVQPEEPCTLILVRGPTLAPSEDGTVPDPGIGPVLRHRLGLLSNAAWHMGRDRGILLLWDSAGQLVRTVGGSGDGPGEFTNTARLAMYHGPNGGLYVNEHRRISVFDAELQFLRTIDAPRLGRLDYALAVSGDGGFVYAGQVAGGDRRSWFHPSTRDGLAEPSFGPVSEMPGVLTLWRSLAVSTDSSFWAGPPYGSPSGLVIEEWTYDGTLLRRIELERSWMHSTLTPFPEALQLPIVNVHTDEDGLLWLVATVVRAGVELPRISPDEEVDDEVIKRLGTSIQMILEVLDPASDRVLASADITGPPQRNFGWAPVNFLPNSRLAYHPETGPDGFTRLVIYEWAIVMDYPNTSEEGL